LAQSDVQKVELKKSTGFLAHVSGRMRKNFIRILPGDRVAVELSPSDMTRGGSYTATNRRKGQDNIEGKGISKKDL